MGESGLITPLVNMLDGKSVDERKVAAKALSSLLQYSGNRNIFQKEERGIIIAISSKCRKQMVAAGAGLYLQNLVEMNVEGLKKLLESLGRGKIWGVFARS
ncbi:vacuolar protein 8 [Cucumis melo var. makuwa]|uniref:Vacuolar protein 8 n=1 Tax=Cucumis melo var. makuwa TaxID=1194695 RepID=A0A5A7TBY1_CUCMM|nr:vacuolar protein 8 [Cucumis melo var. makuwa]TYK05625.1 vacuolar protein 8 [Cucumis melo var. makuwa]